MRYGTMGLNFLIHSIEALITYGLQHVRIFSREEVIKLY